MRSTIGQDVESILDFQFSDWRRRRPGQQVPGRVNKMKAPEWSLPDLVYLHRKFLELVSNPSPVERQKLAFRLTRLKASTDRLSVACNAGCRIFGCLNWQEDVLDEAQLILAESLSADSLHYADWSLGEFASWYWTLCRRIGVRVAKKFRDRSSESIAFVDPAKMAEFPAPPEVAGHPFDRLSRAVGRLPPGREKDVILDWISGKTVDQSAEDRGISASTVERLRLSGRGHVFELWVDSDDD
jgi:DNA-directed RNA polymerase specialized sigma24 family protein